MKKSNLIFVVIFIFLNGQSSAQEVKQSIIYDATTIMNAYNGLCVLEIPNSQGYDIINPLTKKIESKGVKTTPEGFRNDADSKEVILSVLRRKAGLPNTATVIEVKTAYLLNPFLTFLWSGDTLKLKDVSTRMQAVGLTKNESDPKSGGIGSDLLANVVNGTADFLIKRAQEELSVSVFERLKKFISRYPEFDTLFPRTCALIKPVEPYEYSKALDAFKAAINDDIQLLVERIPSLYHIPRYQQLNRKVPSLTMLFSGCTLFTELHGKSGFAKAINVMGGKAFLTEQNNYATFFKLAALLSNSLVDKSLADNDNRELSYIHKDFISKVTKGNPVLVTELGQFYLGLLWQDAKDISITVGQEIKTFRQLLSVNAANTAEISSAIELVKSVVTSLSNFSTELTAVKRKEMDEQAVTGRLEVKAERFNLYVKLLSDLFKLSNIFSNPANGAFAVRIVEICEYIPKFTTGIALMYKDFHAKEYSLGIAELGKLLQNAYDYLEKAEKNKNENANLTSEFSAFLTRQRDSIGAVIRSLESRLGSLDTAGTVGTVQINIISQMQELQDQIENANEKLKEINYQLENKKLVLFKLGKIIEYVSLFAAITKAENSKAVEQLLETYALPAGSSRIKKVSHFNIAVNAYLGGFAFRDGLEGEGFTNTYGLTAPIGFTFSYGFQKWGSASVFLGAFDIGSTVRYKLDNEGKYHQEVSLAGIVSPSIQLVYGWPCNLPISIGAGWQWLSPTTTESNKINLKATFNAFLAVDIPLFNLFTLKRK